MTLPPDDVPRSPSGRVPQWVLDEAGGRPPEASPWRSAPPPDAWYDDPVPPPVRQAPRRRRGARWGRVLTYALVGAIAATTWWAVGGSRELPDMPAMPWVQPTPAPTIPPPSAAAVALADAAFFTPEGRELFYSTRPRVLGAAEFAGQCADAPGDEVEGRALAADGRVGCFQPRDGSIVIYQPADERLWPYAVETAAHETLHAQWARLGADDRAELTRLLEAEAALLPADAPIREQIEGSVGAHEENRPTELFAYLGTQVWRPGGLDPVLEAAFAEVFTDREALVGVHAAWTAMLETTSAEIDEAVKALQQREYDNSLARSQLGADMATVDAYSTAYAEKVDEVAAMPADERSRLRLSWVWWDGTRLPMRDADVTLAKAAALLERDAAALAVRDDALSAQEAAAATERARVEALIADANALQSQLGPEG